MNNEMMNNSDSHPSQENKQWPADNLANRAQNQRPRAQSSGFSNAVDPRQYLAVLSRYWWLILLVVVLGVSASVAYCVFATPRYRALCRYELFRESRLNLTEDERGRYRETPVQDELNRQIVIMKSGTLHKRVMERLRPEWEDKIAEGNLQPKVDINRLRDAVTMVDIHVDAVDPQYARAYLEGMLSAYKALRREEILESTDKALSNLRQEQDDISRELEAARESLTQFRKKHNLTYTQTKSWYDEQFLANLVQRENALRMEETMLKSQFDFLENANAATIQDALKLTLQTQVSAQDLSNYMPSVSASGAAVDDATGGMPQPGQVKNNTAGEMQRLQWGNEQDWQQQQAEVLRLQAEYDDKLETYKAEHPKMVLLKKDIEAAQRNLQLAAEIALKRLRARYDAVNIQLDAVRKAGKAWRRELELTTEQRAEHARLQSKVDHLKKLYDRTYTRILDGSIVDVDALFSRLVEPVKVLPDPVWPAKVKIIILASLASLGLGVAGAFSLDYFDTQFLDIAAIEERLALPFVTGIPDWHRVSKDARPNNPKLVVSRESQNQAAEVYRSLRAAVNQITRGNPTYSLLITSSKEGEGKTLTAVNLAIAQAWSGKKVLLVDGDLRRDRCYQFLDCKRTPGLCEILGGQTANWHDAVQPTSYDNLSFLPAGRFRPDTPEIVDETTVLDLIQEWHQTYDLVIFDSAPAGLVVDTTVMAQACDGVLLVVRHQHTKFGNVRQALHRLRGANMLGFCLNSIQIGARSYRHYVNAYGQVDYAHYAHPYGYGHYGSDGSEHEEPVEETAS